MNDYAFGNFLMSLRQEKGMTQKQLGERLGVSDKAVSKWEMGAAKPRPDTLAKLATLFSVSIDELMAGKRREATMDSPSVMDQVTQYQSQIRYWQKRLGWYAFGTVLLGSLLALLLSVSPIPVVDRVIGPLLSPLLLLGILLLFVMMGIVAVRMMRLRKAFCDSCPEGILLLREERYRRAYVYTKTERILLGIAGGFIVLGWCCRLGNNDHWHALVAWTIGYALFAAILIRACRKRRN